MRRFTAGSDAASYICAACVYEHSSLHNRTCTGCKRSSLWRSTRQRLTFLAPGNMMGMNLKFLLPFWMNSLWSCTQTKGTSKEQGRLTTLQPWFLFLVANLFVDVDGVARPLVGLQAHRRGCHCLVVLGTDDDDDQILFLKGGIKRTDSFLYI